MSMAGMARQPRIVLEINTGAKYDLPVYNLEGQPSAISMQPIDPFDQINVIGDTAKALDRRVDRIIPSDQTGGSGRLKYDETEGVTDFRHSDGDTRHRGVIVCRPKITAVGDVDSATPLTKNFAWIDVYDPASNDLVAVVNDVPLYYNAGAGTWNLSTIGAVTTEGWGKGFSYYFVVRNRRVYRSPTGAVYTALAAGVFAGGGQTRGIGAYDNKLWTVDYDIANSQCVLYASTNPTAAAAAVTFTEVARWLPWGSAVAGETVVQLFPWKDAAGSPALCILTTQRLLMYNAVGGTVEEYDTWPEVNPYSSPYGVFAQVFKSTGDLYISQAGDTDHLMRYSPGAGFGKVTPNRYAGLPVTRYGNTRMMAQNAYGLVAWQRPVDGAGGGAVWFMDAQGGWHTLYRDTVGSNYPVGGGVGNGRVYTVLVDGTVRWQPLPSTGALPQFAVGRKYDTTVPQIHTYAKTDFGTEGTRFTLLGFDLHTYFSDGTDRPGLDADVSVKVEYNLDGVGWITVTQYKDIFGTIRTLAGNVVTATQNMIGFPARLVIDNEFGDSGYDLEWRVTLSTTNENQTPVLVYCAPRAKKTPLPHYAYEFVVDVMDFRNQSSAAGGGALGLPFGNSSGFLHQGLENLDQLGTMVKITYGVGGQRRTDMCEFAMSPQLHPQAGEGRYRISLRSVASDPSG
jgi:hypothetical protein